MLLYIMLSSGKFFPNEKNAFRSSRKWIDSLLSTKQSHTIDVSGKIVLPGHQYGHPIPFSAIIFPITGYASSS